MQIIYPKYIDWSTLPELGFKAAQATFNAALHDYTVQVGKVRRQFAFTLQEMKHSSFFAFFPSFQSEYITQTLTNC